MHPYVWVLVNLHVCWGSVYVMLYEVNLPTHGRRHLAGKRICLSHKCRAISNVSLEKDPNPLYHCSGYPSACGGRRGERKNKERGRVELEHRKIVTLLVKCCLICLFFCFGKNHPPTPPTQWWKRQFHVSKAVT